MNHQLAIRFYNEVSAYFKELTFVADSHEYFIEGKKVKYSVSGKIKKFVEEVDFDKIAHYTDLRDKLKPGTTKAKWKAKADLACANGTDAHEFGEHHHTNKKLVADTAKKKAILKYWADLEIQFPGRYILVGQETRMYHKIYLFSGTNDFTLFDTWTNTFVIGDYKTNEDLFKNHKEKLMLAPFDFLLDCPYNHYQLQLSYYQMLLEQLPGMKVSDRQIIYLLPDETYKVYHTFDYTSMLEDVERAKLKAA